MHKLQFTFRCFFTGLAFFCLTMLHGQVTKTPTSTMISSTQLSDSIANGLSFVYAWSSWAMPAKKLDAFVSSIKLSYVEKMRFFATDPDKDKEILNSIPELIGKTTPWYVLFFQGKYIDGRSGCPASASDVSAFIDTYISLAVASPSGVKGCSMGDCMNGYGEIINDKGSYKGFFKDGRFHGAGEFEFKSGERYSGEFHEGVIHGFGSYFFASGDVYRGNFAEGQFQGHGILEKAGGDKIDAMWEKGVFVSTMVYPHVGCKSGNCADGEGVVEGYDFVYQGSFKNGKYNGYGVMTWNNGSEGHQYEGQWVNDMKHGQGTYRWPSGAYYTGEYVNDLIEGSGTYHYSNGDVYTGHFARGGARHGQGTYQFNDGRKIIGNWVNDECKGCTGQQTSSNSNSGYQLQTPPAGNSNAAGSNVQQQITIQPILLPGVN